MFLQRFLAAGLLTSSLFISGTLASAQSLRYDAKTERLIAENFSAEALESLQQDARAWSDLLQLRVVLPNHDTATLSAVVGDYELVGDTLTFRPRYGWSAGQRYRAHLDLGVLGETRYTPSEITFEVPANAATGDPPTVTQIYPTAEEVPENLLRFYIEFSQPIRRGDVREKVYLLEPDGSRVEAPFLDIGQEFWSRNMRRLTLILDPGRIKTGVAPNVQAGVPLSSSPSYELVITAGLKDAYGRPLARTHRKSFAVTQADRTSPDPNTWHLSQPELSTRQPLNVTLDAAVDPFIAHHTVRVEDVQGQSVAGTLALQDAEKVLTFTPQTAWSSVRYRLTVQPSLEDYAGNRVDAAFDMAPGTVSKLMSGEVRDGPIYRYFEPASFE